LLNSEKELNFKREKLNRRQKEEDKKICPRKIRPKASSWKLLLKLKRPEIKERTQTIKKELTNCINNKKWKEREKK